MNPLLSRLLKYKSSSLLGLSQSSWVHSAVAEGSGTPQGQGRHSWWSRPWSPTPPRSPLSDNWHKQKVKLVQLTQKVKPLILTKKKS